jgi:hypothetical protein
VELPGVASADCASVVSLWDEQHGRIRLPYQAEVDEVPDLLAQGWTPDDPAILDKLGLRADAQRTPART